MKADLFTNATSCPKELSDWLEKHKHVCTNFLSPYSSVSNPRCDGCGWGWNQHEAAKPVLDIETGSWHVSAIPTKLGPGKIIVVEQDGRTTGVRGCGVCGEIINVASGSSICDACHAAAKAVRVTKSKAANGRLFRNATKEERCESVTDTKREMSPDSAS
jgi:hypothetical protein